MGKVRAMSRLAWFGLAWLYLSNFNNITQQTNRLTDMVRYRAALAGKNVTNNKVSVFSDLVLFGLV